MIIAPHFTYASLGECEPMTLLRIPLRNSSTLAIKLAGENSKSLIAILDHPEIPEPNFYNAPDNSRCVAYRDDWVIELLPDRFSMPSNRNHVDVPGVIYAADGHLIIRLNQAGSSSVFDAGYVNLETGQFDDLRNDSVPYLQWRIWASDADRTSARGEPLFHFNHTP